MSMDTGSIYVVCDADDITRGGGKAFSLSRLNESGDAAPYPIFIVRTDADAYIGYTNVCPHNRLWLNIGDGEFFSDDHGFLECGRHGAKFEITTGQCVDGPCKASRLEPVPLLISDGEICLYGVRLVEESPYPDPFSDYDHDDTMEIMIHPD